MQILSIGELLHDKESAMPPTYSPYRIAEHQRRDTQQPTLFDRREAFRLFRKGEHDNDSL